jgi:P-type Cu+ transporter
MNRTATINHSSLTTTAQSPSGCFHCGDDLPISPVANEDKLFCCSGCATVYSILAENDLCDFYTLDPSREGEKIQFERERFAYLDLMEIRSKLIRYEDSSRVHVLLHIPKIHCSSCIYLLENMHRLHPGFLRTELNFPSKELTIVFDPQQLTLREVVEWLSRIGYEPYISLKDADQQKQKRVSKSVLAKLGVAGFAFGNIMLLSFPEYLGSENDIHLWLNDWFRFLAFALSVPVVFYSSGDFFVSAWKSIKNGILNIDAPVAIAIAVTFLRSTYEVFILQAPGYFDSMTGIVFFMLVGRFVQDRTYRKLQFERDYKSYFPIAILKWFDGEYLPVSLDSLTKNDLIRIQPGELVPADGTLVSEDAYMDYSFVTGESEIVKKTTGETLYAGARNGGDRLELQLLQSVSQSYLTSLWNKDIFQQEKTHRDKWLDNISQIFTWGVLIIALLTGIFWAVVQPDMVMKTLTAVLIIACPCTLLLTASFTNGFVLGVFHKMGFYLKSASFLEILIRS